MSKDAYSYNRTGWRKLCTDVKNGSLQYSDAFSIANNWSNRDRYVPDFWHVGKVDYGGDLFKCFSADQIDFFSLGGSLADYQYYSSIIALDSKSRDVNWFRVRDLLDFYSVVELYLPFAEITLENLMSVDLTEMTHLDLSANGFEGGFYSWFNGSSRKLLEYIDFSSLHDVGLERVIFDSDVKCLYLRQLFLAQEDWILFFQNNRSFLQKLEVLDLSGGSCNDEVLNLIYDLGIYPKVIELNHMSLKGHSLWQLFQRCDVVHLSNSYIVDNPPSGFDTSKLKV